MDREEHNKSSILVSIVLHILLIIAAICFKSAHILVPSRSSGIEVSLVSNEELTSTTSPPQVQKPQVEPVKTLTHEAEINLKAKEILPKKQIEPKPEIKPKIEPVPKTETKPKEKANLAKSAAASAKSQPKHKAKPNAPVSDLLDQLSSDQATGKGKSAATHGVNGSADTNNMINNYADQVIEKVRPYVIIPDNLSPRAKAVVEVILLPNLQVYKIKLIKSSGNEQYDSSVQEAIRKVHVFPPLPSGANFVDYRKLILSFKPE